MPSHEQTPASLLVHSLQRTTLTHQRLEERQKMMELTLLSNSGPLTEMKFAPLSLATALANNVFPHPGGPHSRTPQGALIPTRSKISGRRIGRTMLIRISSLMDLRAPRSAQVTDGTVVNPSRREEGWTMERARVKSAFVREREESWEGERGRGCDWRKEAIGRAAREVGRVENMARAVEVSRSDESGRRGVGRGVD
jgi:hypothetical protein